MQPPRHFGPGGVCAIGVESVLWPSGDNQGAQMSDTDWSVIRKYRLSTERPPEWPEGVFGVSVKGIGLLGIHEKSGKLYWDGKEVVTRSSVGLGHMNGG